MIKNYGTFIRLKRTSRTLASPCQVWRQLLLRAPPPPAAAPAVSTCRATVEAGAWRHLARILSLHSLAGYTWSHITTQSQSPCCRRWWFRAWLELRESASAALYYATAAGGRYRGGGGRARSRAQPSLPRDLTLWVVTWLTRDARKTIATQPTTSRTIGVCDGMLRPLNN